MEWFFSYIMKRTIYIQCDNDDDDVPFVVDQHAELDVSASSLKQNSSQVETSFHLYTLSCFWSNQSFLCYKFVFMLKILLQVFIYVKNPVTSLYLC
jgi:hypothetical protein